MLFKVLVLVILLVTLKVAVCQGINNGAISDDDYASMPVLFKLDDYDNCMDLEDALFCTLTFELAPADNATEYPIWDIIKSVSSDPRNYRHDHLRHGICVPITCPNAMGTTGDTSLQKSIEHCYNQNYRNMGLKGNITKMQCETRETGYPIDIYDIIFSCFLTSYIIFVIFASFYEGVARYQNREVYEKVTGTTAGKIISAFSIPKNWYRLSTTNNNPDTKKLRSIQGIRFYNLICVILCHTIMISFAGPVANTKYIENTSKKVLNMFLANGQYAVQTFFLISGWLLSFHFFQMLEGRNHISYKYLIVAFINRYIRLTPTLAIVIAFESTWLVHMGKGPQWDAVVAQEYRNCRKNWWTNLLYINNYVDNNNMCLQQSWYIASDTQLFILSLIILTVVWKNQDKSVTILSAVIIFGVLLQGTIAFINNYDIVIRQYPESFYGLKALQVDAWHALYSSGYSNIPGYTTGLTFGYLFYKHRNKSLANKKIYTILWWLLTFGLCDFIVLIAAKMYEPDYEYTRFGSAVYWALGKNLFALGIAIGIFGFTQKIGWFARWFCEWRSVQIFGRLTYSTYIVHTVLIRIRAGYLRSPLYVNDYVLVYSTLGGIALSYLAGTILCLLVEMPISALQKLMMPRMDAGRLKVSSEKSLKTVNYDVDDYGNNKHNVCTNV